MYRIGRIRTGRHGPHLKSTSIGFPYSRMEAPAQSPTLANSNNRSTSGWRISWTTSMRRKQRTARAHRLQLVRTSTAGTSKDGKKVNREPDRYTQGAVQILLPVSYMLTTRARLPKSRRPAGFAHQICCTKDFILRVIILFEMHSSRRTCSDLHRAGHPDRNCA